MRGVLAAVALVDVRDHLVAAVGGEVEVDVGRRVGAIAEETLEQQVVRQRIDRRDAQQVGHQRVGRRAAALAADAAVARELAHDVPDDQEVVGPGRTRSMTASSWASCCTAWGVTGRNLSRRPAWHRA